MSLFFPPNRGQGLNPWGLFVPPLPTQSAGGPGLSLEEVPPCRTEGCRWHGHPEFGGLCSTCGEGWTPQRLEQLRLLAKEAEAETRARDFEDWDEPGVTFSPQEYDWLRRGVERWAADRVGAPDSFGAMNFVSKLLLESHRLLTPEQARGLWRAVEPMVLDVHDQVAGEARSKFVVLLASFLRSPERWCRIPPHVREEFWPDEAKHGGSCTWRVCAPYRLGHKNHYPYNEILRKRLPLFRESKLTAAACLRRTTLPESVKRRIRNARGRPGPDIPPLLVKRILLWCAPGWFAPTQVRPEASRWNQNSWMFAPNQVRPEACRWMVCNQFRSSGDDESGEWFKFLDHMRRRS